MSDDDDGWVSVGDMRETDATEPGLSKPGQAAAAAPTQSSMAPVPAVPDDGWVTVGDQREGYDQRPDAAAASDDGLGFFEEAADIALAGMSGATSGVEVAGALLENLYPDAGEWLRQQGISGTKYLTDKWSPEYKAAADKAWATMDASNAAYLDRRSWIIGIAQQLPYMVGTMAAARGTAAVAQWVLPTLSKVAARAFGYGTAGAAAGGGESSAGAAVAADAAGLSEEERLTAMRSALPVGLAAGAVSGRAVGALTGGAVPKKVIGRLAVGAGGEFIEEAGTQTGTEIGKKAVGLEFDAGAILESGVGGAFIGGATGSLVGGINARAQRKSEEAVTKERERVTAADAAELQTQREEGERVRRADAPRLLSAPAAPNEALDATPPAPAVLPMGAADSAASAPETIAAVNAAPAGGPHEGTPYDTPISEAEATLDKLRAKVEVTTDKKKRAVAVSKFREASKELSRLSALRDDLQSKRTTLDQPATPEPATPEEQEADAQLEVLLEKYDPEEAGATAAPDPPAPLAAATKKIELSIKRSQAARKGAETRRAKRNPVADTTAARPPSSGASAESAAINARQGGVKPATTPTQVAALQPPVEPAPPPQEASSAAQAPSPAGPVGDPAASQQAAPTAPPAQPVAPPTPKRKSGVVNKPSTTPKSETRPPLTAQPQGSNTAPVMTETPAGAEQEGRVTPTEFDLSSELPDAPEPEVKRSRAKKPIGKMTPDERLTKVLADGPQSVDTVLAALQDAYGGEKNPITTKLIQLLRRAFPASRGKAGDITVKDFRLSEGFQGLYDPATKTIYIDLQRAEDPATVMLHEAVHAATLFTMKSNKVVYQQIKTLMDDAKENWNALGWAPDVADVKGFQSPEEFIAEVLTNTDFADKLDALPDAGSSRDTSVLRAVVNAIGNRLGMKSDAKVQSLYRKVMDFIPDGAFLADGDAEATRAELNALGLTPVASMTSTFRQMLRQKAAPPIPVGIQATDKKRVWWRMLQYMAPSMIARSYGHLGRSYVDEKGQPQPLVGDFINETARWGAERSAFAVSRRYVASQIADYFKNANDPVEGLTPLNNMLHDARMWALDPSVPMTAPINTFGISQPGGATLYGQLSRRWAAMMPEQRHAFEMVRDYYSGARSNAIGQMMLSTVRSMVSADAANRLEVFLDSTDRTVTAKKVVEGIEIKWQRTMDLATINSEVAKMNDSDGKPLSEKRQKEVIAALRNIYETLAPAQGPYIPLRRDGDYFAVVRSADISKTMSKAALEAMIAKDRMQEDGGSILIKSQTTLPSGQIAVTYRHEHVTAHETSRDADEAVAAAEAGFPAGVKAVEARRAIRQDVMHESAGLKSASLETMKDHLRKTLGVEEAKGAIEEITRFYLERLPDTSARKAQLKANRVSGASHDMLSVFASSAHGTAYFEAQMKFGHRIAKSLGTDVDDTVRELRKVKAFNQADDVVKIAEALRDQDNKGNALAVSDMQGRQSKAVALWQRMPGLAGAWLLTGPGTIITNSFQPVMLTLPHLAARHGYLKTTAAMLSAYRDLTMPTAKETAREVGRFAKGVPTSVPRLFKKGGHALSFKNPQKPFFRSVIENLNAEEQQFIEALVKANKLEHGQVADLQAISKKEGRGWNAVTYVTEAAFILPQATETLNRAVTALASYRLNKARNPELTVDMAARIAATDIDQTQFDYGQHDKSAFQQSEFLRAALVFKQYPIRMFYTLTHNMVQSFNAESPAEKAIARKTVAGMMMTTMLASGAMGVMAFEPLYWAAVALIMPFSDDDDPESVLRRAMSDWNETLVGMLLKGPLHGAGVADTSRMAFPQLLPAADIKQLASGDTTSKDAFALLGRVFGGAPGSLAEQSAQAAGQFMDGEYAKGFTLMSPKAFGINDAIRALAYDNKGVENTAGYTMMKAEDLTLGQKFVRVLGFEPAGISDKKAAARGYHRIEANLNGQRTDLMTDFGQAFLDRDREAQMEARDAIIAFNQKHPEKAIPKKALVASVKSRMRSAHAIEKYGVNAQQPGQRRLAMELQDAY